jgi:opacity protein-like surface antigen
VKKFLTTFAVLAVIATPAFAQSVDPDNGTGNVLQFSPKSSHSEGKFSVRQDAMLAYATAPFEGSVGNSNAPQATGGGSTGYNEMLRNY